MGAAVAAAAAAAAVGGGDGEGGGHGGRGDSRGDGGIAATRSVPGSSAYALSSDATPSEISAAATTVVLISTALYMRVGMRAEQSERRQCSRK